MMNEIRTNCMYNDSDEDCNKCVKHGYIYSCRGCKDFDSGFGHAESEGEE